MGTVVKDAPDAEDLTGDDTHWVPCQVCGQAVPSHWQMGQHLETLKPLIGMKAICMICNKVGEGGAGWGWEVRNECAGGSHGGAAGHN